MYIKYKQYTPAREDESSSDGAGPGETCEALAEDESVHNDFMLAYYECTFICLFIHSFTDLLMHFTLCVIMYIFVNVLCIHLYFTLISSYFKRSFINALYLIVLSCNYYYYFLIKGFLSFRYMQLIFVSVHI